MNSQEAVPLTATPADLAVPPSLSSTPGPAEFFLSFLMTPAEIGAVVPSSTRLAHCMTEWLRLDDASVVAEFGPGTGAFTSVILEKLPSGCNFFALEINSDFAGILRRRFSGVRIIEGDVSEVATICDSLGVEKVDCIVSGLPWASFSPAKQEDLLAATLSVLRPGGQFVTFSYLQGLLMPGGQRFRRLLNRSFAGVSQSRIVWGNLPPAFVYRCHSREA